MNLIGITFTQSPPDPLSVSAIIIAIITAIWSIVSYIIRKSTDKKYQEQIEAIKTQNQKEIEQYKSELVEQVELLKAQKEKLNYITKTQFDAEFKMYQELSDYSFRTLLAVEQLFPIFDTIPNDQEEQNILFEKRYKNACETFTNFQNLLYKYAPFISKELYQFFENFRQENKLQINMYPDTKFEPNEDLRAEYKKLAKENYRRTPKLSDMHNEIIEKLREYLQSLKVIEG